MKYNVVPAMLSALLASSFIYAQEPEHQHHWHASYLPDISLTVDTSFVNRSLKDEALDHLEIPGVARGLMGTHAHDEHAHPVYNANNGFNLNYAELALHAIANNYFRLKAIFHLSEHGFDIEEAHFTSTALPYSLTFRGGKFRSDFGRINHQHRHNWDFSDMPLVYLAFLGSHGLNDIGVQLQWVAPTSTYLMAGIEVLQGDNEQMFGRDAITVNDVLIAPSASAPSLLVGYLKTSLHVGTNTHIGLGASLAFADARLNNLETEEASAFYGDSSLYGVEMIFRHTLSPQSYVSWQSEWLHREFKGSEYRADSHIHVNLNKKQSGYYTQLIYAYNEHWRTGARYDQLYNNNVTVDNTPQILEDHFDKYSVMIDYAFSESTRLRLQFNRNNALFNEEGVRQHINTYLLQWNISIGAHEAHDASHL